MPMVIDPYRGATGGGSASVLVAVARTVSSGLSNIMYSLDGGGNWLGATVAVTGRTLTGVAFSESLGRFVVTSRDAVASVLTSEDGQTWTPRVISTASWESVCWSPSLELFVAVTTVARANNVMTSPDGITWTEQASGAPMDTLNWDTIIWAEAFGLFIAGSAGDNDTMTSPDGVTWTDGQGVQSLRIAFNGSRACAITTSNIYNTYTDDGLAWTQVITHPSGMADVAASSSLFVICSGLGVIRTSPDAIIWTTRANPGFAWRAAMYAPVAGRFVVFADAGFGSGHTAAFSSDGITWTQANTPAAFDGVSWIDACEGVL